MRGGGLLEVAQPDFQWLSLNLSHPKMSVHHGEDTLPRTLLWCAQTHQRVRA